MSASSSGSKERRALAGWTRWAILSAYLLGVVGMGDIMTDGGIRRGIWGSPATPGDGQSLHVSGRTPEAATRVPTPTATPNSRATAEASRALQALSSFGDLAARMRYSTLAGCSEGGGTSNGVTRYTSDSAYNVEMQEGGHDQNYCIHATYTSYRVVVNLERVYGAYSAGIIFGDNGDSMLTTFTIDGQSGYCLTHWTLTNGSWAGNDVCGSSAMVADRVNTLQIVCTGDEALGFVNGGYLDRLELGPRGCAGRIGTWADAMAGGAHLRFNELQILVQE